jgi:hypothetical protein
MKKKLMSSCQYIEEAKVVATNAYKFGAFELVVYRVDSRRWLSVASS